MFTFKSSDFTSLKSDHVLFIVIVCSSPSMCLLHSAVTATAYALGRGVTPHAGQKRQWLTQAASHNHTRAQYLLGVELLHDAHQRPLVSMATTTEESSTQIRELMSAAATWFRRAAENGDARAMLEYSELLANNIGIADTQLHHSSGKSFVNFATVVAWMEQAAAHGIPEAMLRAAFFLDKGMGTRKNTTRATAWIARAATDEQYLTAFWPYGFRLEQGRGVARDDALALRWITRAAAVGDTRAMYNLG